MGIELIRGDELDEDMVLEAEVTPRQSVRELLLRAAHVLKGRRVPDLEQAILTRGPTVARKVKKILAAAEARGARGGALLSSAEFAYLLKLL